MDPVRITATSGRIEVTAEARADVVVERGQEHPMGGVLEVQGSHSGVTMRVPIGTDLIVGSHSGKVRLRGELGTVRVTTRSGSVEVEACASLDARTVSGRVDVGRVTGDATVKAANGRVTIADVGGAVTATSVSGTVAIGRAGGAVHATTVSGRVDVGLAHAADVRAESVSGRVRVALPEGVHPDVRMRSVSGRCECALPEGDDCRVVCRSISGRITVAARDSGED
jgi:DUF4097 and DUF4098 domain-containing protein YvlB